MKTPSSNMQTPPGPHAHTETTCDSAPAGILPPGMRFGLVVLGIFGLIGFVFGVQQFLVKFLYDQSAHTRTIWGLLYLLLSILGPALPLLLILKRKAFARLGRARRWAVVLAIPMLYWTAIVLCMVASTDTKTLIINRAGLKLLVRLDPANPNRPASVEMHGLMRELPWGRSRDADAGTNSFHFMGYQTYRRFPNDVTISARETSRVRDDGSVELTLETNATETFRLQVEGLAKIQITRNGQPVSNQTSFAPGKHQISVIGHPK
jgi:hypothetical protein